MRHSPFVSLAFVFALTIFTMLPVLAQEAPPNPPPEAPADATAGDDFGEGSTGPGEVGAEGIEGDGRTCGASSENPHASGHRRGRVNAIVWTRCPLLYPQIYVYPWLKHKNNSGNWVTDDAGPPTFQNERRSGVSPWYARAKVNTPCPNNKTSYRAEGYHYVVFSNGSSGFTWTKNTKDVQCD